MKEPHIEGPATHDDPESCVGAREGAGEALTGARCGQGIEPRNQVTPGCRRRSAEAEGNTVRSRNREAADGPARSKTPRTRGTFLRENREIPWPPAGDGADGPHREGRQAVSRR